MSFFYNKEINIYEYKSYEDEHGIDREGYIKINEEPIMVDMQPYSSEKAKKDYGYDIECTRRMFCDIIPGIIESSVIKYRNQFYSIQQIVEWDDYLDVMLLERRNIQIMESTHE